MLEVCNGRTQMREQKRRIMECTLESISTPTHICRRKYLLFFRKESISPFFHLVLVFVLCPPIFYYILIVFPALFPLFLFNEQTLFCNFIFGGKEDQQPVTKLLYCVPYLQLYRSSRILCSNCRNSWMYYVRTINTHTIYAHGCTFFIRATSTRPCCSCGLTMA